MRSFLQALLLSLAVLTVGAQNNSVGQGIITVQSGKFADANCREYQFAGGNVWQLLEKAAASTAILEPFYAQAVRENINVIRAFGHGSIPSFELQPTAGQYNENAFRALDNIIAAATTAGVKLILTLTDNWTKTSDGLPGYVAAAGLQHPEDFFTSPAVLQLYQNHQKAMANRVNTVNGRMYKDEPAILAWDLINEPRSACDTSHPNATCEAGATAAIQAWIEKASDSMKAVDANHMVTVGEEGFYGFGATPEQLASNPDDGSGWAEKQGQNWAANHAPASIDFAATHIWVDNWAVNQSHGKDPVAFINQWLTVRSAAMAAINKPMIIEEFGKQLPVPADAATIAAIRDPIFRAVYDSLKNLDNVKGAAYWERDINNAASSDNLIRSTDSTFTQILGPAAAQLAQKIAGLPPIATCTPGPLRAGSSSAGANSTSPASVLTPTMTPATAGRRLLQA